MLQFPTNFHPDNESIDTVIDDSFTVSFTFNGDAMYGAIFHVYDYKTGEMIDTFSQFSNNYRPTQYQGDTFSLTHNLGDADYDNLRDYIVQAQIIQGDYGGSANVCDILATSGIVKETSLSATTIIIEAGINCIYEWGYSNGKYYPTTYNNRIVVEMKIEINNQYRSIVSYDPTTGEIVIDSAFSDLSIVEGMSYRIYANYLITPQYFLMCRRTPNTFFNSILSVDGDPETHQYSNDMHFEVYGGSDGYSSLNRFQHYEVKLYWHSIDVGATDETYNPEYKQGYGESALDNIETYGVLVGETGRVYKQNIESVIPNAWYLSKWWDEPFVGFGYFYIVLYTQTEYGRVNRRYGEYAITSDSSYDPVSTVSIHDYSSRGILRSDGFDGWVGVNLCYSAEDEQEKLAVVAIYRQSLTGDYEFVGCSPLESLHHTYEAWFQDAKCPLNTTSNYILVPTDQMGKVYTKGIKTISYEDKSTAVEIIGLDYDGGVTAYTQSKWMFEINIENPTLSFNINPNTHIGYENFPSVSRFGVDYVTGNVTADLSYISCPDKTLNDSVDMIKAWRKFISAYPMYLLKDLKGNVFLVQIIDTPTVSWEEQNLVRPTTISFDWIEVKKLDEVVVGGGVG